MTDETATPQEEEQSWFWRGLGVVGEGVYDGAIMAVSSVGLVVDAVNHAPRLVNVIPGVDGVGPISDRPFLGSTMIRESLTGAHDAYKDLVLPGGATMFDPQTPGEHVLYGAGYVGGAALGSVGTGATLAATREALMGGTALAQSFNTARVAAGGQSVIPNMTPMSIVNNAGGAALDVTTSFTRSAAGHALGFSARHPILATGALTAADIAYNDGRVSGALAETAGNAITERIGLGPVFGDSARDPAQDGWFDDPTKLAGMVTSFFAANALLGGMFGDGGIGKIFGVLLVGALVLAFNGQIGEMSHSVANTVRDALNPDPQRQAPVTAPAVAPTPAGP